MDSTNRYYDGDDEDDDEDENEDGFNQQVDNYDDLWWMWSRGWWLSLSSASKNKWQLDIDIDYKR